MSLYQEVKSFSQRLTDVENSVTSPNSITVATTANIKGNVTLGETTSNTVTVSGDLAVNGGDLTSTATTFNLLNSTVTTLNIGAAATTLNIGNSSNNVTISGDLKIAGNDIKASDGTTAITLSSANVTVAGDITVGGNDIKASDGTTAITLSSNDVAVAGDITSTAGNFIVSTSGKGVDFSATATGGTNISELLDDYEEGTWTPSLLGSTGDPTVTYSVRVARYTKVGNRVFFNATIQTSAISGGSGNLTIGGLPFTSTNVSNMYSAVALSFFQNITFANILNAYVEANKTSLQLANSASATTSTNLQVSAWAAAGYIIISGHYITDS